VALIALGFYFGYAAYVSNSIFIPMVLHFINNFLAVLAFMVLGSDELMGTNVKHDGSVTAQIFVLLISALLFAGFIIYLKRNYSKFATVKGDNP